MKKVIEKIAIYNRAKEDETVQLPGFRCITNGRLISSLQPTNHERFSGFKPLQVFLEAHATDVEPYPCLVVYSSNFTPEENLKVLATYCKMEADPEDLRRGDNFSKSFIYYHRNDLLKLTGLEPDEILNYIQKYWKETPVSEYIYLYSSLNFYYWENVINKRELVPEREVCEYVYGNL